MKTMGSAPTPYNPSGTGSSTSSHNLTSCNISWRLVLIMIGLVLLLAAHVSSLYGAVALLKKGFDDKTDEVPYLLVFGGSVLISLFVVLFVIFVTLWAFFLSL